MRIISRRLFPNTVLSFLRTFTDTRPLSVVSPEKVHGVHQLSPPAGDEEWKIRPGLQTVPEDDPSGQSQACYPGQQLPSPQVCSVLTVV